MITIHMHDDGRVQLVEEASNAQRVKYVGLPDLLSAFREQPLRSPVLPQNALQFWQGFEHEAVALYAPAHHRKMMLMDKEHKMPVPATIFVLRFNRQEVLYINESAIFTVVGPFVGPETVLYSFPYGNVFDDNRICWGEVGVQLKSLFQAASLVDLFLGSVFNFDLSPLCDIPSMTGDDHIDLPSVWTLMEGEQEFPKENLLEVGTYEDIETHCSFLTY